MNLNLTPSEWTALGLALGQFIGQNEYLAGKKTDNAFSEQAKVAKELVEKMAGVQYVNTGHASLPTMVDTVVKSEKRLWGKWDYMGAKK